jgi:hypothetical protein
MAGFIPSDNVRRGLSRAQGRDELLLDTGYGRVKDLFRFGAKGFQRILSQLLFVKAGFLFVNMTEFFPMGKKAVGGVSIRMG